MCGIGQETAAQNPTGIDLRKQYLQWSANFLDLELMCSEGFPAAAPPTFEERPWTPAKIDKRATDGNSSLERSIPYSTIENKRGIIHSRRATNRSSIADPFSLPRGK